MATNGYVSVAATPHDELRFSWWYAASDQSIPNNQTLLRWKMELIADSYGAIHAGGEYAGQSPWRIVVDGQTFTGAKNLTIANGQTKELAAGTKLISHNADGSRSFAFSFSQEFYITFGGKYIEVVSGSGTGVLDTIPRYAALVSAPDFTDEENPKITYSNPAGSAVTALEAAIYAADGMTAYMPYQPVSPTGSEHTFDLSAYRTVLQNATPNSNALPVLFCLRTTIGTAVDVKTLPRTMTIVNGAPVLSPAVTDSSDAAFALTGSRQKLIRYISNAAVTVGAAARKGAHITQVGVTNGSQTLAGDGTFSRVESPVFTFYATDSRGNTKTETVDKTADGNWVPYVRLTCVVDGGMPDGNGNFTFRVKGACYHGSFGARSNTLSVYYRYKETGGSAGTWTAMAVSRTGDSYTARADIKLDYEKGYVFEAYARDALETAYTPEKPVKATPVFDWGENDFAFHVPVSVQGISVIPCHYGTSGIWTWRKWENGIAEFWGRINAGRTEIVQATGPLYVAWNAIPSMPFPFDLVEVPNVLVSPSGDAFWLYGGGGSASLSALDAMHPVRTVPSSQADIDVVVDIYVKGRWKSCG